MSDAVAATFCSLELAMMYIGPLIKNLPCIFLGSVATHLRCGIFSDKLLSKIYCRMFSVNDILKISRHSMKSGQRREWSGIFGHMVMDSVICLQCFDAVGWAAGSASSL